MGLAGAPELAEVRMVATRVVAGPRWTGSAALLGPPYAATASDIKEPHVLRVALDERAALLDVFTHQDREHLVRARGVVEGDLQQDAVVGIHGGVPQLIWVHLAEALVALDRVLLRQPLALLSCQPAAVRPARRRCRRARRRHCSS